MFRWKKAAAVLAAAAMTAAGRWDALPEAVRLIADN